MKENVLAEVLNPRLTVDAMVERALEKSKDSFRDFCEFMENNKELGKANCIITFHKIILRKIFSHRGPRRLRCNFF
jgi:hypothetical protein